MSAAPLYGCSPTQAAWHGYATQRRWWHWASWAIFLLGIPSIPALMGVYVGDVPRSLLISLALYGAFSLLVLAGMWGLQVSSLLNQNHPTLARLVPGHARRLRLNLVLSFLILGSGSALICHLLLKSSAGAVCIAALVYVAIGLRWPLAWTATALLGFAPLLPRYLPRYLPQGMVDFIAQLIAALATPLGLGCLLAAGAVFLAGFIHDGDATHQTQYERLQRRRRALKASMAGEGMQAGCLTRTLSRGYYRDFERTLARAAAGRAGFKREMLALGPQAHASVTTQGLLVFAAILAFALLVLRTTGTLEFDGEAGQGVANSLFGLIGVLVGGATQLRSSLVRRRHEQALISLLPGVPRGREFNRRLARALMGQYLALWALGSALTSLLLLMLAGTQYALIAFCTTALGAGLVLLRDWTGARLLKGWLAFLVYLPLLATAFVARLAMQRGALGVGTFLALAALLLVSLYAWRWRAALRAPMAWPVGRRG